jgi:lipoprotein-releasing system ATP-binding protein
MSEYVLEATDVRRSFRQGPVDLQVLQGVNLAVKPGERLAIIGASGSGKTTLLQILGGLDKPSAGTVKIAGSDIHALAEQPRGELRNRTLGFIYQFHHLLPEFSALENVAIPQMILGRSRREGEDRARKLLTSLGLAERLDHRPAQLSGGEQQRTAICRALANRPRLILADEPTGNLDPQTSDLVFHELIGLFRSEGVAALIATHNLELARRMDRVVVLDSGLLVEIPPQRL